MTPEELNRKIEFIVESQARLAAAQEQDRQDRVKFEEWSKGLLDQITRTNDRLSQTDHRLSQIDDRVSHTGDRLSQSDPRPTAFSMAAARTRLISLPYWWVCSTTIGRI